MKEMIKKCIEMHDDLFRKDKFTPYYFHCLDVVSRSLKWGLRDENTINAILFHDYIEEKDQDGATYEDLSFLGDESINLVKELTFLPQENIGKDEFLKQKEIYLSSWHPHAEKKKSCKSLLAKVADRYCNVSDFIDARNKYAYKYLRKADILIESLKLRKKEIEIDLNIDYELIISDFILIEQKIELGK